MRLVRWSGRSRGLVRTRGKRIRRRRSREGESLEGKEGKENIL